MYRLTFSALMALALLVPSSATIASQGAVAFDKGIDATRSFEAQRQAVIEALGDGKTYSEIAPEDIQIVRDSLARMSVLLGGVQDVNRLPEVTRVEIFNEQERINTLLTRAHADSRLVCRREKPTGSNRRANTCMTVAERRRASEGAQEVLRHHPRAQSSQR